MRGPADGPECACCARIRDPTLLAAAARDAVAWGGSERSIAHVQGGASVESVVAPVFAGKGLTFAEGINFDRDGTLYCVDVTGGGIWRMPPGGELQEWVN